MNAIGVSERQAPALHAPPEGATQIGVVTVNGRERPIYVMITAEDGQNQTSQFTNQLTAERTSALFQAVIDKHELRNPPTDALAQTVISASDDGLEISAGRGFTQYQTHEEKDATGEWNLFKQHVLGPEIENETPPLSPGLVSRETSVVSALDEDLHIAPPPRRDSEESLIHVAHGGEFDEPPFVVHIQAPIEVTPLTHEASEVFTASHVQEVEAIVDAPLLVTDRAVSSRRGRRSHEQGLERTASDTDRSKADEKQRRIAELRRTGLAAKSARDSLLQAPRSSPKRDFNALHAISAHGASRGLGDLISLADRPRRDQTTASTNAALGLD